jgi:hypothetical protein
MSQGRSESGRVHGAANLANWHALGRKHPEIEEAVERFRSEMLVSLGPKPAIAQEGLVTTAAALYAGILVCQRRLLAGRGREGDLLDQLPLLSGALNRVVRTLNLHRDDHDDKHGPPPGATLEEKRVWAREYVQRCFAETRSKTP